MIQYFQPLSSLTQVGPLQLEQDTSNAHRRGPVHCLVDVLDLIQMCVSVYHETLPLESFFPYIGFRCAKTPEDDQRMSVISTAAPGYSVDSHYPPRKHPQVAVDGHAGKQML